MHLPDHHDGDGFLCHFCYVEESEDDAMDELSDDDVDKLNNNYLSKSSVNKNFKKKPKTQLTQDCRTNINLVSEAKLELINIQIECVKEEHKMKIEKFKQKARNMEEIYKLEMKERKIKIAILKKHNIQNQTKITSSSRTEKKWLLKENLLNEALTQELTRLYKTGPKWVKRYSVVKNVDDLPDRGSLQKTSKKEDRLILAVFERNPSLSLRGGQSTLRKKGVQVSCDLKRRRLMANDVKYRSTVKKPLLSEKHVANRLLGLTKIWTAIGTMSFFLTRLLFGHTLL
ncbi:hypothetical protein ABEB36_010760 [Hypothenemus hampei]|uniref:Transposase Tc1-like domain-containing protein n=1 Tax=Hypothenemus hampei TaxID=57062 RepID=A0ABD1ECY5_HYPHA